MPTSDTDLDEQLRAAMKTLDDEVPSGYFEALPDLTLARLEDTMQHGTQDETDTTASAVPQTTEDSGLHDIRNLAQSTKQRISSKRASSSPPVSEDDMIASSSAGWKAVALPQPAKMVALPELSELPSPKEVRAREKAAAKPVETTPPAAAKPVETASVGAAKPVETAPVVAAIETRKPAFSLPTQSRKSKAPLFAVVGIGLAAAAGAAIFVTTQHKDVAKASEGAALAVTAAPAPAVVAVAAAGSAAVSPEVQKAQDELAKAEAETERLRAEAAAMNTAALDESKQATKAPVKSGKHGASKLDTTKEQADISAPADTAKAKEPAKKVQTSKTGEGEPDFNQLLKEAGVKEPQAKKPVLDKKELSGDDFKKGMAAIAGKAHGCYKGTQGTATVKLVIAPSGQISTVSVGGQFASTPEGECVIGAVKGASFPAWEGHPQSFTYPILLAE
jgi:hypothetical protein